MSFVNKEFGNLMMNWLDILNTKMFVADSSNPSDKSIFPQSSSSKEKLPKKSKSTKKRKSSKSKKRIKKTLSSSKSLLPVFEMSTNTSSDVLLDLQHGNEGFDLHIGQTVCDNSRPSMGEEASSYFLMRHSFTYPGALMTMLQGPMAAITGGYGYRISAEAVHRDKYVLVGTYSNNTVEGVWEHTWNKNIKSHLTFVAGFESSEQKRISAMMAAQQGIPIQQQQEQQSSSKFPAAISYIDYKSDNYSTRFHLDMMNNQLSLSFNRRLTSRLQIGTRIVSSYEKRKSLLEFASKYQWGKKQKLIRDAANDDNDDVHSSAAAIGMQTIEATYHMDNNTLATMYTNNISSNASLTSRLMWRMSSFDALMASIGYKYQFGRHMGLSKTICGEIAGDGNFRQMITFPILGNMICKFYAEINHFLSRQQLTQGHFPHKFGFQLNIHL